MTNRWLTGVAAAAFAVTGAVAAQAADLPTRKAPPPIFVPPPFTWTGFYIGANAGGVWETGTRSTTIFTGGFPWLTTYFPSNLGSSPSGGLIGGQAGYNYQWGAWVFGVETDLDWTDLNKKFNFVSGPILPGAGVIIPGDTLFVNAKASLDWLGTTRGRIGFVATPDNRLMFYGTGGVAYGGGSASFSVFDRTRGLFWGGNPSSDRVGWTIGGGVEYAITNNITIKGEYLYYNLGNSRTVAVGNLAAATLLPGVFATARYTYEGSIIRGGVNYKF